MVYKAYMLPLMFSEGSTRSNPADKGAVLHIAIWPPEQRTVDLPQIYSGFETHRFRYTINISKMYTLGTVQRRKFALSAIHSHPELESR